MKKLLFVIGNFYPAQSGGPSNTVYWLAKGLVKNRFHVTVATSRKGITPELKKRHSIRFDAKNEINGIHAYYFGYRLNRYLSPGLYVWLFKNLKYYDFVNVTSYFFPVSWLTALLCAMFKVPFSVAPRGELEDNAIKFNRVVKLFFINWFLKKLYSKAEFFLATSAQEEMFIKKYLYKDQTIEILPNLIDLEGRGYLNSGEIISKRNILYLGKIHRKKAIEKLIEAYNLLSPDLAKEHRLIITGGGGNNRYFKFLKKTAGESKYSEYIEFLGHKIAEGKDDLYRKSKVFVLPSDSENFGNVVIESLSFSTPVVASRFTPWSELETANAGLYVDNSPQEIAQAIQAILCLDEEKYKNMCNSAFEFVNNNFNLDSEIPKLAGILDTYCGKL